MLCVKSFTEIASRMTPKTFRIIWIPFAPIIRSIFEEVFKTIVNKITLKKTAIMMFSIWKFCSKESKVVKLPGPAINGKANGKIVAEIGVPLSDLCIR